MTAPKAPDLDLSTITLDKGSHHIEYDSQRCMKAQRPKNWDAIGRAEANR